MSSSEDDGDFYSDPVKQLAKFNEVDSNDDDDLEINEITIPTPPIKITAKRNRRSTNSTKKDDSMEIKENILSPVSRKKITTQRKSTRLSRTKKSSEDEEDLEIMEICIPSARSKQKISKKQSPRGTASKKKRPTSRLQKMWQEQPTRTPKPRGRGRKRQANMINSSIIILSDNEDTEQTTAPNTEQIVSDVNFEHKIKVWWQCSELKDFHIRKYQKIKPIFDFYAEREQIPLNRLIFLINNKTIQPTDTPDSLNLEPIHIIEGGCVNEDLEPGSERETNNASMIQLKVQLRDRKKPLHVYIKKTEPLSVLMAKCSEELECEIKNLKFQFDGDSLNPQDTPESLDFDGGECIDVFVK